MSEIITNKLTGKTAAGDVTVTGEGTATMRLSHGLCKGWIDFDGTSTAHIDDSFQYSSLTDNGTGNYTTTLTNAMNAADYSCVFGGSLSAGSDPRFINAMNNATTTQRTRTCNTSSASALDWPHITLANFGDLA